MSQNKDPIFDARVHNIISLEDVFKKSASEISKLSQEFKTKGWSIVRMPKKDTTNNYNRQSYKSVDYSKFKASPDTLNLLNSFFSQDNSKKEGAHGYSSVNHKESVHLTSPTWNYDAKIAPSIKGLLVDWLGFADDIGLDFIEILSGPIFGCDQATLAHRADLPVAFGHPRSMLDIAFYKNEKTATLSPDVGFSTDDVNCVPHYDPGFLSLSFLSTHDGLQLQDPATGTWYAGPVNTRKGEEDLAVIWLGAAAVKASKGELKAGVHRVVYPQSLSPRIAAWFELCTVDQVNEEISRVPETGDVELPNLLKAKPLKLVGDRRLIERHYGIPMSKVMRRSDNFAAAYSKDKPADAKGRKNGFF